MSGCSRRRSMPRREPEIAPSESSALTSVRVQNAARITTEGPIAPSTPSAAGPPAAPEREPAAPRTGRRAPDATATPAPEPPRAEAVPEAAPDAGTLRIVSDVPGAQVFMDRQFIGAAPTTAEN